jgi:uncharacterized protein YgiM (DUF1202 family)
MKKSHRKDVIIARIIFAILCLLLITLIVVVVVLVRGKMKDNDLGTQSSQLEGQLPPETENPDLPPVTESGELISYIWTTDVVNLREEPNTDCNVINLLDPGTKLEFLDEKTEGWAHVILDGQEGYVSTDYITNTDPSGEE